MPVVHVVASQTHAHVLGQLQVQVEADRLVQTQLTVRDGIDHEGWKSVERAGQVTGDEMEREIVILQHDAHHWPNRGPCPTHQYHCHQRMISTISRLALILTLLFLSLTLVITLTSCLVIIISFTFFAKYLTASAAAPCCGSPTWLDAMDGVWKSRMDGGRWRTPLFSSMWSVSKRRLSHSMAGVK